MAGQSSVQMPELPAEGAFNPRGHTGISTGEVM